MNTAGAECFITFAAGDAEAYAQAVAQHEHLQRWTSANAVNYGLPSDNLHELAKDETASETLLELYNSAEKKELTSLTPPRPLTLPPIRLHLSPSSGLVKTTKNFLDLLTDSRNLVSKKDPKKRLRYKGCAVHRIEQGFVVQGGDVTRGDGSGGESIYGPTFNDEKEGLKVSFQLGTIAMANSGKNSNSSQFFITLTSTPSQLAKLNGKYVAFAQADLFDTGTKESLEAIGKLGDGKGGTKVKVWIEECGVLSSS